MWPPRGNRTAVHLPGDHMTSIRAEHDPIVDPLYADAHQRRNLTVACPQATPSTACIRYRTQVRCPFRNFFTSIRWCNRRSKVVQSWVTKPPLSLSRFLERVILGRQNDKSGVTYVKKKIGSSLYQF